MNKERLVFDMLEKLVKLPCKKLDGAVHGREKELLTSIIDTIEFERYTEDVSVVVCFDHEDDSVACTLYSQPCRVPAGVIDLTVMNSPAAKELIALYHTWFDVYAKRMSDLHHRMYKWLMRIPAAEISEEDTKLKFRDELKEFYKFIEEEARLYEHQQERE